jgi:hypothetical protein
VTIRSGCGRSAIEPHKRFTASARGRVVAEHPVRSEQPEVAGPGDRILGWIGNRVFVGQPSRVVLCEQPREFFVLEPDEADVEVFRLQRRELNTEKLFVPTCA